MATLDQDAIARASGVKPSGGPLSATPERAVLALGLTAIAFLMAFRFVFRDMVL